MANNQHIHCTVNSCHYWNQGNKCQANEILVTSDRIGESRGDSYDATMATSMSETPVGSCMETCCKTYVSKGSDSVKLDGVYRQ
ncbi:MAG TPA: DUF1540 domain-containing protein [Firmicutes bacterium]|jgi:hypothetical protein|nr:DUF1540 domain-containing protein [Bacillota bacterium]